MTAERDELANRVRAALAAEQTREVSMFGGLSFMVNGSMVVAVRGDGGLLVRVDPGRSDELLELPGAEQAQMGTGREMGAGWIDVARDSISSDEQLDTWIGLALEYNAR